MKKLVATTAMMLSLVVALAGCGTAPTQQLFDAIEKASALETTVPASFEQLKLLEAKDQNQYGNILTNGAQSNANVKALIENTSKALEDRQKALDDAKLQLDAGYKLASDFTKSADKLKDEQLKKQADEVITAYTKRYETFQTLHKQYSQWIAAEKSVYEALKTSDTSIKSIQESVAARNQVFQQVEQLKQQFNDFTKQFNEKKQTFYTAAGIQPTQVVSSGAAEEKANEG
ncbi:YkyA family protein [Paenibacillus taiwanensis]|uniref:YkyA family protein n=1 Tax=Paenibacillus taiwanensis TaxID=401638 RepID=UPI00056CF3B1|nr:YkyA family protein [Paenibacillus taiwanensis]